MPTWGREDLEMLRNESFAHRSKAVVDKLFAVWGGSVRYVLVHSDNRVLQKQLEAAIDGMNKDGLEKACSGEVNDKVFHTSP